MLRLNKVSAGQSAAGRVVNLLSNDVSRFDLVTVLLHQLWIAPILTTLITYLIWLQVGISALAGVVTLIVLTVPLHGMCSVL